MESRPLQFTIGQLLILTAYRAVVLWSLRGTTGAGVFLVFPAVDTVLRRRMARRMDLERTTICRLAALALFELGYCSYFHFHPDLIAFQHATLNQKTIANPIKLAADP
jgi:hypothetical protein